MIVNTEKPKTPKKREKRYRCGKNMDKVIDHRLLLNSIKANDCFDLDKNMDKPSDGELLHDNVRTRNCANRDKKIERLGRIHLPAENTELINLFLSGPFLRKVYHERRLEQNETGRLSIEQPSCSESEPIFVRFGEFFRLCFSQVSSDMCK